MSQHDDGLEGRGSQADKLIASVERHILEDQHDAIGPQAQDTSRGASSRTNNISDPTGNQALSALLAPYAAWRRDIYVDLGNVHKAFDKLERTITRIIGQSTTPEAVKDAEERCPGWNAELRARLGGCGKVLERYTLSNGETVVRPERMCAGCRSAKRRAERDAAA